MPTSAWGQAAEFWIDDLLLPVTPKSFKVNNENGNESTQLVDGVPLTIPKLDKAQRVEISFMVPLDLDKDHVRRQGWVFSHSKITNSKYLTNYLWSIKQEREPVTLTIILGGQGYLNAKFLLDDYTYTQEAENASDYEFTLSFSEYYPAENQEVNVELQNTLVRKGIRSARSVS